MVRKTLASLIDEALSKRLWRQLPPKVRRIVEKLCQWLESLEKELTELRQQHERLATCPYSLFDLDFDDARRWRAQVERCRTRPASYDDISAAHCPSTSPSGASGRTR